MSSITNNFRVNSAKNFIESLRSGSNDSDLTRNILYLFLAKSKNWSSGIELFEDSILENNLVKGEIYSLKRLNVSNLNQIVPKITWSANNRYDIYNSYIDISNKNFYVVNSQNQVFKCLDNGSRSLTQEANLTGLPGAGNEPTRDDNNPNSSIVTPDGYTWRYLYTISAELLSSFNSSGFIPITNDSEVSDFALENSGRIESIYYVYDRNESSSPINQFNSGKFYTEIKGDGNDGLVEIIVESQSGFNIITKVNILNNGTGYTYAYIDLDDVYTNINLTVSTNFYPPSTTLNYSSIEYIKPIISPEYGHGYDIANELFANKVMLSESLQFEVDSGNIPINANFCRYGVIKDPRDLTLSKLTSESYYAAESLLLDVVVNVESGTLIQQNLDLNSDTETSKSEIALGIVVSSDSVNINGVNRTLLRYYKTSDELSIDGRQVLKRNDFVNTEVVYIGSLSNSYNILNYSGIVNNINFVSGLGTRHYNQNTGEILEIENINIVKRASDQTENIKFIIEF